MNTTIAYICATIAGFLVAEVIKDIYYAHAKQRG